MAVSEAVLDAVRAGMRGLQPPKHFEKVYKDECMYSYDTPESPGGLYVNLKTYQVQMHCGSLACRSCWSCGSAVQQTTCMGLHALLLV